jgi:conjugal transfer ATP-binding protein TraC
MSASAWNRFLDLVFGDAARADAIAAQASVPMLSDWLPYRSYDPATRLFINTDSMGFIVELAPMVGADERTGDILTQFLSDGLPDGCEVQIIHWKSPAVGAHIADWVMPRVLAQGVYGRAAQHRAHFLRRGAWRSIARDAPFCLRQHRVLVSIGAALQSSVSASELGSVRESLGGNRKTLCPLRPAIAPSARQNSGWKRGALTAPLRRGQQQKTDPLPETVSRPAARRSARARDGDGGVGVDGVCPAWALDWR